MNCYVDLVFNELAKNHILIFLSISIDYFRLSTYIIMGCVLFFVYVKNEFFFFLPKS